MFKRFRSRLNRTEKRAALAMVFIAGGIFLFVAGTQIGAAAARLVN